MCEVRADGTWTYCLILYRSDLATETVRALLHGVLGVVSGRRRFLSHRGHDGPRRPSGRPDARVVLYTFLWRCGSGTERPQVESERVAARRGDLRRDDDAPLHQRPTVCKNGSSSGSPSAKRRCKSGSQGGARADPEGRGRCSRIVQETDR